MARVRTGGTRTRRWVPVAIAVAGASLAGACGPRRSEESFCEQLRVVRDLDEVLAGGGGPRTAERAAQLQDLQRVSPETIEPQVGRLVAVTDDLARTLGSVPDADAAAKEVFSRRRDELPDITAAGKAVEAYAAEHCQVQLNPTDSAPPTTVPPPPPPTTATSTSTRARTTTTRRRSTTKSTAKQTTTRRSATTTTRAKTTTTRRR